MGISIGASDAERRRQNVPSAVCPQNAKTASSTTPRSKDAVVFNLTATPPTLDDMRRREASRTIQSAYLAFRERRVVADMVGSGWKWAPLRGRPNAVERLSGENLGRLRRKLAPLTSTESEFLDRGLRKRFYGTHYTDADIVRGGAHGDRLVISSRRMLLTAKTPFPMKNTLGLDLQKVASDDHVFFSVEVGDALAKPSSRFGSTAYKVPLDAPRFRRAQLSLNDPVFGRFPEFPEDDIRGLSAEDGASLTRNRRADLLTDTFHGKDAIPGLLLSAIAAARTDGVSANGRRSILSARSSREFNGVVNGLFRPEVRVPRRYVAEAGAFRRFRLASEKGSSSPIRPKGDAIFA